jgi:hypothetical protein
MIRVRALAAILAILACRSSPEQDLKKLGKAVRQGDSAEAVRYLDVERTTSTMVSEAMSLAGKHARGSDTLNPSSKLGNQMGEAMLEMMRPGIEAMIKQGVYDLISGRSIRVPAMGKGQSDTVSRDSILQLAPRILGSRELGDSAFVSIEIHPRDRAMPETLEVKMEQPEKIWRVVRVDGLQAALSDSLRLRK